MLKHAGQLLDTAETIFGLSTYPKRALPVLKLWLASGQECYANGRYVLIPAGPPKHNVAFHEPNSPFSLNSYDLNRSVARVFMPRNLFHRYSLLFLYLP
jgi:hypothetical protein